MTEPITAFYKCQCGQAWYGSKDTKRCPHCNRLISGPKKLLRPSQFLVANVTDLSEAVAIMGHNQALLALELACRRIREDCLPCGGTGYAEGGTEIIPERNPENPDGPPIPIPYCLSVECQYCGEPIRAVQEVIKALATPKVKETILRLGMAEFWRETRCVVN